MCVVLFVVDDFYVPPGCDVAISIVAKCGHKAYRDHNRFQDELFCSYSYIVVNFLIYVFCPYMSATSANDP